MIFLDFTSLNILFIKTSKIKDPQIAPSKIFPGLNRVGNLSIGSFKLLLKSPIFIFNANVFHYLFHMQYLLGYYLRLLMRQMPHHILSYLL